MISYINDMQHKCHIAEATNKITRVYIGKYEKVSNQLTRANDGYNTTFETMRVKSNVYARYPGPDTLIIKGPICGKICL